MCYFSKKLQGAEQSYSATDLEFLAIVRACGKWRCYLQGQNVLIYTDHEPLKYLQTQPHVSSRQARWLEKLSELHFRICYIPGKENIPADVLSRYQVAPAPATQLHDLADVNVATVVSKWLAVVAPHLQLQTCIDATRASL